MLSNLTRGRSLWLGLAAAVLVLGLVGYLVSRGGPEAPEPAPSASSSESVQAEASAEATAAAPSSTAAEIRDTEAAAALERTLAQVAEALQPTALESVATAPDLSPILTGDALEAHLALVEQWIAEGIHQEGSPTLEQVEVISEEDGLTVVQACVVTTDVRILDANGNDLSVSDAPHRTRTLFTLTQIDGAWKLVDEAFAEELDC